MRIIKNYIMLSVLLVFYVSALTILLSRLELYKQAYRELSRMVAHPSIEIWQEESKK